MSIVLDASVTMSWHFEDERTKAIDQVLLSVLANGAVAPRLWRLEVGNSFLTAVRRKRIEPSFRDASLARLAEMPIELDDETDARAWSDTLRFAERFNLTLYDAAYLELAARRTLPLATLDRPLRTAAITLKLPLLGLNE